MLSGRGSLGSWVCSGKPASVYALPVYVLPSWGCRPDVHMLSSMNIVVAENTTVCSVMSNLPLPEDFAPNVMRLPREAHSEKCSAVQVMFTLPQPEVPPSLLSVFGSYSMRSSHVICCENYCYSSWCCIGCQWYSQCDSEADIPCTCPVLGQQCTCWFHCYNCLLLLGVVITKIGNQVYQINTLISLRCCAPAYGFSL